MDKTAPSGSPKNLAILSVISNTILVIIKVIVGLVTGSVSVLSEAIHSGIDLLAAVMALWAIRAASKPPDKFHPYGHGKLENVSGTIEAILIFVAAIIIIIEAIHKIKKPEPIDVGLGIWVMLISSIVNWIISNQLLIGSKKYDSLALEADGWHLRTDVYTSAGVMAGLLIIKGAELATKNPAIYIIDPIVAILTAIFIIKAAWELTSKSFLGIVDTKLPDKEEKLIKDIINDHYKEFVDFHNFRTRKSGAERFVDLHLVMKEDITVKKAHDLCDHLEDDIMEKLSNCNVLIHIEPDTSPPTGILAPSEKQEKTPTDKGEKK